MTTYNTREEWLQAAVVEIRPLIAAAGLTVPEVRVGVGWTSKGKRAKAIGECWATSASADGINEITINVNRTEPVEVLGIMAHECLHAATNCVGGHRGAFLKAHNAIGLTGSARASTVGPELAVTFAAIAERLGQFPGAGIKPGTGSTAPTKQTTRMIKVECDACGFLFRTTAQWIAASGGWMRCPASECDGIAEVAA